MLAAVLALLTLFATTVLGPTLSLFLPLRPTVLTVALASVLPWPLVAFVAVLGGTVGALPLYAAGRAVGVAPRVRRWFNHPRLKSAVAFLQRESFLFLLLIILLPLPDQLMVIAGVERHRLSTFLLANVVGRALFYFPLAYLGFRYQTELLTLWHQALRLFGL